jgi:linoleoyl-CoA desaturase
LSRLRAKAVVIAALVITSYLGLVFVARGPLVALPLAAVLVVALVATATSIMHDANHGAFGASRALNGILAYSADVLGASSWFWRQKHNTIHHANTNVVGVDTDIEQMPLARLAPAQPRKPWHRYQHLYLWVLYGFLPLQWVLLTDVGIVVRGRIRSQRLRRRARPREVALVVAGKLFHLAWAVALPLAFHPWWVVLAFYLGCSWAIGFVLAVIFQLAHCVEATEFTDETAPRRGDDFGAHQLHTTANVACTGPFGWLLAWLMGGLHHQVEHHLAPRLPHTSYPAMSARVRAICAARGLPYHTHASVWAALRSHGRWLRTMGRAA